jgi:hypothetical protein
MNMERRLGMIFWPLIAACAASQGAAAPERGIAAPAAPSQTAAKAAHDPEHHHHHHHGSPRAVREVGDVRAEFEVNSSAEHFAMAKEMGIQWAPEPGKDSHLSVMLSGPGSESLRGLAVELSVTDPSGQTTKRAADVMSAPGMYHYGIDFQRTAPGSYGVSASFERSGRKYTLGTAIDVP